MINFEDFKTLLAHLKTMPWHSDVEDETIYKIAVENFHSISKNATKNRNFIRLIGQSGSGKTTQLLPASEQLFKVNNLSPIVFSVRKFASWHPNYNNLVQKYGQNRIREITNGFALRCLLFCAIFSMENGYDAIFEVTILSKQFEAFIAKYLNIYNYNVLYLCLAINKKTSTYFINKRKISACSQESGRIVNSSSSNFFYKTLLPTLKYLSKITPNERIIIFNAFDPQPKYDGQLKNCIKPYVKERKNYLNPFNDELLLLNAKKAYLKNNVTLMLAK